MRMRFDLLPVAVGAALALGAPRVQASDPGFWAWENKPAMGWNSWDCFATTVTEAQILAEAGVMKEKLAAHGWNLITVDIQWYEPNATGFDYRKDAKLSMDEWGRLMPATNKFPSAADSKGFKPLADHVHSLGLKFGVHLMRGIPRQAVAAKMPVKGTGFTAADIANTRDICQWNGDMYGVDMSKPGAQEYYDSVFEQFARWGIDFVKVDDLSRPYHKAEIEAIRKAICESPIHFGHHELSITTSIGVAWTRGDIEVEAALVALADHALYTAKEKGRNRVEVQLAHEQRSAVDGSAAPALLAELQQITG